MPTIYHMNRIKKEVEKTLNFLDKDVSEVWINEMKCIVTFSDDSKEWFFYSSKADELTIRGLVVSWFMDDESEA